MTHLEQLKQQCYHRALDEVDSDISQLTGEKDAYVTLQSLIQQSQSADTNVEKVIASIYPGYTVR